MKKLFLATALMFGVISFSFAQTTAKTPAPDKKEVKKPAAKTTTTAPVAASKTVTKAPVAATPAPANKNAVVLKKDGTPDKRYTAKTKTPLKKDGTPDKRFKENKKP